MDEIKKHVWPSFDITRCQQELRNQGKPYPRTCAECGLGPCKQLRATYPGDKAAEALLSAGTQPPAVESPDADLESIDRVRLSLWLIRCADAAPEGLYTEAARMLMTKLTRQIEREIEAINKTPDESTISRW